MKTYGSTGPARAARTWREVADQVFVRRFAVFNVNSGLIVGDGQALVVDTRSSERQARELLAEIRWVTHDPLTVMNTHHHFDHVFGNCIFEPAPIWGHEACAARLREGSERIKAELAAAMPELAAEYTSTSIVPPDRIFRSSARLDIGGRAVDLLHLGRGHTDNDAVVVVPDTHVVFAGDLVEQGAPPSFEDSYPLDWPGTLARLLELAPGSIVPGHGDVVGRAFVEGQLADLAALADLARRVRFDGGSVNDALPLAPFPAQIAREALRRAFGQLSGEL